MQVADAEDLTQDVLLKLAMQLRSFQYDASKSFHAWLKTITNNALIDAFKKNRRAGELLNNVTARKGLMEELQPQFDREVLEEAMARVQMRVERATWEAFRLTGIEGFSAVEAAKRLGVPEGRIRVQKGRIAKLIREEVKNLGGSEFH
jgi:RNA polymerase sigma-70 factor (ECF subfamily)